MPPYDPIPHPPWKDFPKKPRRRLLSALGKAMCFTALAVLLGAAFILVMAEIVRW